MAEIKLSRREAEDGDIPLVCMRCGARATGWNSKTFAWHPPWVFILILLGLLPFCIVALILTKRMKVKVPLCAQHKNHWTWRTVTILVSCLALVLLGVGAIGASANLDWGGRRGDFIGMVCPGLVLVGLVWLIIVAIIQHTAIRPTEITDRSITLVKVAPGFVEALSGEWEDRREDRYEDEDRGPARRRTKTSEQVYDPRERDKGIQEPDDGIKS